MPHSMTGFGSAEGPVAGGRLQVDLRSVNHRHFNAQLKLPPGLGDVEARVREALRARVHRGHVVVSARWTEEAPRDAGVVVNIERARDVLAALESLRGELGLSGDIEVSLVARQPDVLTYQPPAAPAVEADAVVAVVDAALDALIAERAREGTALAAEVDRLVAAVDDHLQRVEARAPERISAERDRLQRAVAELMDGRVANEDRLAQEIALLADKLDITEEIVRLRTHLQAARDALAGTEPVGKQLGFLAQEMLREINTIGSKANDAAIAHEVIAMKGEIERLREQIENLE